MFRIIHISKNMCSIYGSKARAPQGPDIGQGTPPPCSILEKVRPWASSDYQPPKYLGVGAYAIWPITSHLNPRAWVAWSLHPNT